MNEQLAIHHLLLQCEEFRNILHWQVVARVSLSSLHRDARITSDIYTHLDFLVSSGQLMDYQHLLTSKPRTPTK